MNRRYLVTIFGLWLASAPMAMAEGYSDHIVAQLSEQGFVAIRIETTLLGRVRIIGQSDDGLREIILNPNTGEILRDMWLDANGNPIVPRIVSSGSGSGDDGDNSGSGSDNDSDNDPDEDSEDSEDSEDREDDREDDRDDREDDSDSDSDSDKDGEND